MTDQSKSKPNISISASTGAPCGADVIRELRALHDRIEALENTIPIYLNDRIIRLESLVTVKPEPKQEPECEHITTRCDICESPTEKKEKLAHKLEMIFNYEYTHRPIEEKNANTWNTAYSNMAKACIEAVEKEFKEWLLNGKADLKFPEHLRKELI